MFAKMKTGTKILAGFGIALAVAVVVGIVGYRGVNTLSSHVNDIGLVAMPGTQAMDEIKEGQWRAGYALRGLLIPRYADPKTRLQQYEVLATAFKDIQEAIARFEAIPSSPEVEAGWKQFLEPFAEWKKSAEQLEQFAREKDRLLADGTKLDDPKIATLDDKTFDEAKDVRALMSKSQDKIDQLDAIVMELADKGAKQAASDASSSIATMFVMIGLSAVGLLVLGVLMGSSISKVLNTLIKESTRLSQAAVNGKLQTRGNPDLVSFEFRPIVEGVNATLDAVIGPLNVAADYVDRISKGNIPQRITDSYNGDFNAIKNNLNECIDAINGLITEAKALSQAAADGELDVRADDSQYQGEYRAIIRGMNMTLEGFGVPLRDISQAVQRMANKDFTQAVDTEYPGAYGILRDNVNLMVSNMRAAIEQITESAGQFAEGSRTIAESAQTLAQGAQTQSASVEEMTASTEELARSVSAVRDNANESTKVAIRSNQLAEEGGKAVQKSIESMEQIRHSSQKISEIIQVISEIASQTNLLALNAAIEAARAGEHGMGFAVVADEVRKLAERSNQAAREISSLIKESTQRVEEGAQLSTQTGESLKQIIQAAEETAAKIQEIAKATVEQAANTDEASKAIQGVSQVTEQTAAGSEEMAASSEQLGAQSAALRDLVSQFRVGTSSVTSDRMLAATKRR